jgi:manganese transport protein
MEGFLRRRVPLAVRRLITMAPAFALLAAGADPVRLLIVSQVALSVGLPSVLIPLVLLTSRRAVMGALVNRRVTTVTAIVITAGVIGLSGVLLCLALTA